MKKIQKKETVTHSNYVITESGKMLIEDCVCIDGKYVPRLLACVVITNMNTMEQRFVHINSLYNNTEMIYLDEVSLSNSDKEELIKSLMGYKYHNVLFENIDVLKRHGYFENYENGSISASKDGTILFPEKKNYNNIYKYATYERFKNNIEEIQCLLSPMQLIKYGVNSPTFIKTEGKKYTYGIEIETIIGKIPRYIRQGLNICCKYDGSLKLNDGFAYGGEYITGILKGDAGFLHLYKIIDQISKRCMIDKRCSIHVHIGNVDFTQEFIVWMYKLAMIIEYELFSIVPLSRRTNAYCKAIMPLKIPININSNYEHDIIENFNAIKKIINFDLGTYNYTANKTKDHPLGHNCGYNKKTPRYWWLNFVPAMYNTRKNESYTLEFRLCNATMNYKKIENWILICMGIVNFVENHKKLINESITLSDIMQTVYPKSHENIIRYINERKQKFSEKNNSITQTESEDSEYSFDENICEQYHCKKQLLLNG
jgi:hypothetical protein